MAKPRDTSGLSICIPQASKVEVGQLRLSCGRAEDGSSLEVQSPYDILDSSPSVSAEAKNIIRNSGLSINVNARPSRDEVRVSCGRAESSDSQPRPSPYDLIDSASSEAEKEYFTGLDKPVKSVKNRMVPRRSFGHAMRLSATFTRSSRASMRSSKGSKLSELSIGQDLVEEMRKSIGRLSLIE